MLPYQTLKILYIISAYGKLFILNPNNFIFLQNFLTHLCVMEFKIPVDNLERQDFICYGGKS
ncbi:Uncharacterised protein [Sphingobacterium daejeonense]|nr:Uncharacterised protein [Sphingobacterium daejeonense]